MGRFSRPLDKLTPKGTHPPLKHVLGCVERKYTLLRVSCGSVQVTEKQAMVLHPTTLCGGHRILRVGQTADLIEHAKFHLNRFWGFGAPGAKIALR